MGDGGGPVAPGCAEKGQMFGWWSQTSPKTAVTDLLRFIVIVTECDEPDAERVADRIEDAVRSRGQG